MNKILNWIGIIISIFCAIMMAWHWNDHEVSAWIIGFTGWFTWIIGFTGWFNYTLDRMKEAKNDQV